MQNSRTVRKSNYRERQENYLVLRNPDAYWTSAVQKAFDKLAQMQQFSENERKPPASVMGERATA